MQDLSHLYSDPITALAPTSQAGGNMMSDSKLAMTAPGSLPTDPLPPEKEQGDPAITASNSGRIRTGTSGKPKAKDSYSAPRPSWGTTTTPDVVRES